MYITVIQFGIALELGAGADTELELSVLSRGSKEFQYEAGGRSSKKRQELPGLDRLTGHQKVAGLILLRGSEIVFEPLGYELDERSSSCNPQHLPQLLDSENGDGTGC